MTRFFAALVIPAICAASIAYFGYYTIWGTRGLIALGNANARLEVRQQEFANLDRERTRLAHRVQLLQAGDRDIVQEVARGQLLEGQPGEVAVPRGAH